MRALLDYVPRLLVPYCFVNFVLLVGSVTGWLPDVFWAVTLLMFCGAGALYAFVEVVKVTERHRHLEQKRLEREEERRLPPPGKAEFMSDWTKALHEKEKSRR